ncbi:branched-chain amino acid ABC transporter permease [Agrobacterium sp. NPDC090283]|uniref:branched-chain amino acid ABC transporter permease n=1 Tax=Agrobacterium sp. NPDC090283 TaxID=3363920 RepID=UPI00383A01E8
MNSQGKITVWPFLVGFVLVLVASLALPGLANRGIVFVAGVVMIDIVVALGFNFLLSTAGILSFGQAMFIIVGGYGAGIVIKTFTGLSVLPALAAAGLLSGLLAAIVGFIALRRVEGSYFAVLTLALSTLVYLSIGKIDLLGREDGLTGIGRPDLQLGFMSVSLTAGDRFYYLIVIVCMILTAIIWLVTKSQFGRAVRAIRHDPQRAAFLGINVQAFRLMAFVFAGTTTGIASALLGPWTQVLTTDLGHWAQSTEPILHVLLGGAGFFWGPALGAVVFAALAYMTRTLMGLSELVTGGLLLFVVLAFPGGLLGIASRMMGRTPEGHDK